MRAMKQQNVAAGQVQPSWSFQVLPSLYQHTQKVPLLTMENKEIVFCSSLVVAKKSVLLFASYRVNRIKSVLVVAQFVVVLVVNNGYAALIFEVAPVQFACGSLICSNAFALAGCNNRFANVLRITRLM